MIEHDGFFDNWYSFGNRLYRFQGGRWIPTTEEVFAVELSRYNKIVMRKRRIEKATVYSLVFAVGFILGTLAVRVLESHFGG